MGTWNTVKQFGVDPSNYDDLAMIIYDNGGDKNANYKVRTLFTTKAWPDFCLEHTFMFALINIPLYLQIQDQSMDEFTLQKVLIQVNDPDDHALIDSIVDSLYTSINDVDIYVSA